MLEPLNPRNPAVYEAARGLRRAGLPYKRIAVMLEVSPGSAYKWTRDIELSPEQVEANRSGPTGPLNPEFVAARAESVSLCWRERRRAHQNEGRRQARKGNALHMAGCMLYWAEGSKDRNMLTFCNSDRHMVAYFASFLRECFELPAERFSVRLNVYTDNGLTIEAIEDDWLETLELPRSSLRKHQLNHFPTSTSGRKKNKLPYGVCTLRVLRSTHLVQHIYGAIQEYGGFDEPAWLG